MPRLTLNSAISLTSLGWWTDLSVPQVMIDTIQDGPYDDLNVGEPPWSPWCHDPGWELADRSMARRPQHGWKAKRDVQFRTKEAA